jgi:hypothetical protein
MKNTPSALKWLAEKRARIAGALLSAKQVQTRLTLDKDRILEELALTERLLVAAQARCSRIQSEVAALDQVVQLYDSAIQPDKIEPIKAWQGNYGRRGAFRQFVMETFKNQSQDYITSKELEVLAIAHFSLVFEHDTLRQRWFRGSFKNTLKVLTSQGYLERLHPLAKCGNEHGAWRWKQEGPKTLAQLRDAA